MSWQDTEWGTLPEWLAAVGTIAAFVVALILLWKQLSAYRASEHDRLTSDASKVAGWWQWAEDAPGQVSSETIVVKVRNAGDAPVYDCKVMIPSRPPHFNAEKETALRLHTIAPGETVELRNSAKYFELESPVPDEEGFTQSAKVWIRFRDSDGRQWRRTKDGVLEEDDSEG